MTYLRTHRNPVKLALFGLTAPLILSGCVTPSKYCSGANLRRATYNAAITAADAYTLSGRPVPQALLAGRQAAVTALTVLDATCPQKTTQ